MDMTPEECLQSALETIKLIRLSISEDNLSLLQEMLDDVEYDISEVLSDFDTDLLD